MSYKLHFSDHNVNTLNNNLVHAIKEATSLSGLLKIHKTSQNRLIKETRPWYNDSDMVEGCQTKFIKNILHSAIISTAGYIYVKIGNRDGSYGC